MSKKAAVHSADGVGLLPSHGAAGCGCQSAPPCSRASSSTATVYLGYECGSAAGVPLNWKWTNFGDMVSRYWDVVSALAKLPVPVSRQYVSSPLSTPGVCLQPKRSKALASRRWGVQMHCHVASHSRAQAKVDHARTQRLASLCPAISGKSSGCGCEEVNLDCLLLASCLLAAIGLTHKTH